MRYELYNSIRLFESLFQPKPGILALSKFLGVSEDAIQSVLVSNKKAPSNYRELLPDDEIYFLDNFFTSKRISQWDYLENKAFEHWN